MGVELLRRRVADDDRDDACPSRSSGAPITATSRTPRVAREHVLDLERMDVLAARDDHVVEPAVDPEVAVLVEVAGVAGVVPAVADRLRVGVGPVPVAGERLVAREVRADLAVLARAAAACSRDGRPAQPGFAAWSRPIEKV